MYFTSSLSCSMFFDHYFINLRESISVKVYGINTTHLIILNTCVHQTHYCFWPKPRKVVLHITHLIVLVIRFVSAAIYFWWPGINRKRNYRKSLFIFCQLTDLCRTISILQCTERLWKNLIKVAWNREGKSHKELIKCANSCFENPMSHTNTKMLVITKGLC